MDRERTRITRNLLACVVIVGSLALWTVVPVAWLYLTSDLVTGGGARFVLAIFGCPLMMGLTFVALSRIESYRRELSPPSEPASSDEQSDGAGHSLLEVMLVVSAAIAPVALVLWWILVAGNAEPSGPLQPV